jgi:hypothetical protein
VALPAPLLSDPTVPDDSSSFEARTAASGEEAALIAEAEHRVEATLSNLAHVVLGNLDINDVLTGAIRSLDVALGKMSRARE